VIATNRQGEHMSLKQAYERTQPKSINDFFQLSTSGKSRRTVTSQSNFFTKLNKTLPAQS
ncbi:hypothetical protein, partial [Escherichia coli]|uniref:hypothetical protein n=1 Tax=Escherichia coli TaxID=562 RepID=UPI001BD24BAC